MVPFIFKAALNYICILLYVPLFIPFQIFNFLGNSVSVLLWVALGVLTFALICVEVLFVFTWIAIFITYLWSAPDNWLMWTALAVAATVVGLIDGLTGGTFDFEKLGEKSWILELMEKYGPKEPEPPKNEEEVKK